MLDVASLAHADLLELSVDLHPYVPFAERVWSLRATVTADEAGYVAMAEAFDAPLATLDARLGRAAGQPGSRAEVCIRPPPVLGGRRTFCSLSVQAGSSVATGPSCRSTTPIEHDTDQARHRSSTTPIVRDEGRA